MYEVAATLDPDRYYRLARATYGEMVLAGISAVGEFHYLHHGPGGRRRTPTPNAMGDALIAAAAEAGIRITLLDTCYLRGGPASSSTRCSGGSPTATPTRGRRGSPRCGRSRACGSAPPCTRCGPSTRASRSWPGGPGPARPAARPRLRAAGRERPGARRPTARTPVEVLADAGALDDRFTAVHATHVTPADIGLLGAARCSCCICPTTERDLADGIGPTFALRDAGARLTLGSDSHAVIDLLEEARARRARRAAGVARRGAATTPLALLRMATEHGHHALGWPDAGRIEAGALADLTTVGLDSVRTAGTATDDALAGAVFAATAADVHHVVVGGRVVVRDGQPHAARRRRRAAARCWR